MCVCAYGDREISFYFFYFFLKKFYCAQRGRAQSFLAAAFLMAARTLLSSSLFLLAQMCPPHPFLDELEGPLVPGDLEQLHGPPFIRGEAAHLLDHVPHKLGVLGEVPVAAAVPRLAHILGHLVAPVEVHSRGVAQSHGCCSSMAAALQWLLRRKRDIFLNETFKKILQVIIKT